MAMQDFFTRYQIGVDLALEARDLVRGATGKEIQGVEEKKESFPAGTVTMIKILDQQAEAVMGKPRGTYITIEAPELRYKSPEVQESVADTLANQLKQLLHLADQATVLIIGLGNWQATPDALGPSVVRESLITRHLKLHMPETVPDYRPVCAFAPGVLGITGIESAEIIQGIVSKVQPSCIIAIDSLAATDISRLGTTIQISDTGISPGSGVNNKRTGINFQTMGIPVIAIGIPTVVNAAIIAKYAVENYAQKTDGAKRPPAQINEVLDEVLKPFAGGLIVTPREIDDLISNASQTITRGITLALHPRADKDALLSMMGSS